MATVIPHEELVRKAVQWVCEERKETGKPVSKLIDEAGRRFNLTPKDSEFLVRFLKEQPEVQD